MLLASGAPRDAAPHPTAPGWPREEPADGQECGQGSQAHRDLSSEICTNCLLASTQDRTGARGSASCPVPVQGSFHESSGGGCLVDAVGRDGRPHPTFTDSENAEQEQSGDCHPGPDPTCSEQETWTRSAVPPSSSPWGRGAGALQGPRQGSGSGSGPRAVQRAVVWLNALPPISAGSRKGASWCHRPPHAGAPTHTPSVSPCVFILSINGIFSNGDWEMDLVFKKIRGF